MKPLQYCILWGDGRAFVPAVRAPGIAGHYANGELWVPDRVALRAALPYRWRKAFDREGSGFWFSKGSNDSARATLLSARGEPLVTLYANPPKETE